MQIQKVTQAYFSPNGTTQIVTETIAQRFCVKNETVDLLRNPLMENIQMGSDSLLVVGMPVYAGRVPALCVPMLKKIKGKHTPAIAVAVYGNREYEDALLELCDILDQDGFAVVGAGAFIAQHSIFSEVAAGRPDEQDLKIMGEFADRCKGLLEQPLDSRAKIKVSGNTVYRKPVSVPIKPDGDKTCIRCGVCAQLCPTGAIPADNPRKTNGDVCISCGACIHNCPVGARSFHGLPYRIAAPKFAKANAAYKKPELFYIR